MSQRANQQTRSHSTSSTEPAQGATTSEEPRGAAKEAGTSLMKKASALFFGVGLNQRHPERERQAQARREERARRRAAAQQGREEGGYDAPVAAHMFSGRSFLTAVVVGVIALGTAYPVVTYIDQDREIKRINTHISQLQQENAQLKAEQTWWNDDNYVRQQARSRLYYVNPG
ncbi:septum formation initiator family protein, partial [uncultured Rothia sp.]